MKTRREARGLNRLVELLENRVLMAFGAPNSDFGVGGTTNTTFPTGSGGIEELLDVGGKVLAAGDVGLARFTGAGVLDTAFGTSGRTAFSGFNFKHMAVDSNGRIYVLVSAAAGSVLLRYSALGKTDNTFGKSGTALVTSSTSFNPAQVAIQGDGKIVVAGTAKADSGNGAKVRVYRLNADGTSDSGFGSSSTTEFNFSSGSFLTPVMRDTVTALRVLSNGKIMIAGGGADWAPSTNDPDTGDFIPATFGNATFAVARLNSNGSLDSSFGSNGVSRVDFSESFQNVTSVQPTAGSIAADGSAIVVARDLETIAQRFSSSGDALPATGAGDMAQILNAVDALVLEDGRAVVLGTRVDFNNGEAFVMQYVYGDGSTSNAVDTKSIGYGYGSTAAAIRLSSDGDFLVGSGGLNTGTTFAIGKFDAGKKSDKRPDEFANARANDIAQDNEGRLHVAYYDAATTTLKYAMRDEFGLWTAPRTVDANANAGQYVSIDVNSAGLPAIAYFDGTNGDLKLARLTGSDWEIRSVESKGSVGLYPSLDFDDSNRPTMTYYKKTTGDLRFARFDPTTSSFSYETVDATNDVGRSSVLVASPRTRRYSIAYTDSTTNEVKWAGRKSGGVGWNIKSAATTAGGADFLSMAYGNSYEPAISYYDAATADLKLTYFDSAQQTFLVKTLATSGAVGLYSQAVFSNYFDQPIVYAYNRTGDRVIRFNNTVFGGPTPSVAIESAGRYLSIDYTNQRLMASYFDADVGVLKVRPLVFS